MIKTVIFDIGGVLIDFTESEYLAYLRKKENLDVSQRDLEEFVFPLITLMEYGTLNVPKLEEMVGKHFGISELDMHWVEGWKELAKPNSEVIDILNRIKLVKDVALLSNVSKSRFAEMERTYRKLIDGRIKVYASCFIKMRKPGPHVYEYVLKEMRAKPSETVFIDNQIENVLGAEAAGMKAIWYRDHQRLVHDLKKCGVL